jgi:hypothetical protein
MSRVRQSPPQVLGVFAPMVIQPSAVWKAWYGAWLWCADPSGPPTSPVAKYLPASHTARLTPASNSDTSIAWPTPVRSRSRSAAVTARAR